MPIALPIRKQLEKLPKSSATWTAGSTVVDPALTDGAERTYMVCTQGDGALRAETTVVGAASDEAWSKLLLRAMQVAPADGRAMVPKVIKVSDIDHALAIKAIVAPLKIKVELAAGDLVAHDRTAIWAAPTVLNPPTLADERALWRQLYQLHAIHFKGDESCDLEFALTTEIAGWPAPEVLWGAVRPGKEAEAEALFIFRAAADRQAFYDGSDDDQCTAQFIQVFYDDPCGFGNWAWQRAEARGLDHHLCHVATLSFHEPRCGDAPREQLDETETAVLHLVAQALLAWATLHRVGTHADLAAPGLPVPPSGERMAVPGTTATIVRIEDEPKDQAVPAPVGPLTLR